MFAKVRTLNPVVWIGASVAGLFFALEIVLLQSLVYATTYFYGQLIIALGLLGMLIGGLLASKVSDNDCFWALNRALLLLPLAPLGAIAGILTALSHTPVSVLFLVATFTPFGFILSILYRVCSSWSLYMAELLGALIGMLCVVLLIPYLREENILLLIITGAISIALIWQWRSAQPSTLVFWVAVLFLSASFAATNITSDRFNFAYLIFCDVEKEQSFGMNKVMCGDEKGFPYSVIRSLGSNIDRIDVFETTEGEHKGVAYSGTRNDLIQPYPPDVYIHDARIPGGIIPDPRVLIIGSGAEGVAKVAKAIGAEDITVVEYNQALVSLWREDQELIDFAYDPFGDTTLLHAEGRSYLRTTDEQFDIITLMNTHRGINIRQYGQPDFLHTKESYMRMFERLTNEGFLSIEMVGFASDSGPTIAQSINTIHHALRERGVVDPSTHLIVYQWVGIRKDEKFVLEYPQAYTQILAKRTPWTESEITSFSQWATQSSDTSSFLKPDNMAHYRTLWLPDESGIQDGAENSVIAQAASTISPHTPREDARPFTQVMSSGDKMLFHAVVFSTLILMAVCAWPLFRVRHLSYTTKAAFFSYMVLIGLGFMGIEIFLMQWLQLYTGSVVWAFVFAIGGLFLANVLSVEWYWKRSTLTPRTLILCSVLALAALLLLRYLTLPGAGDWGQVVVAVVTVLFVGACIGPFFPYGISCIAPEYRQHSPLLVGLNGSALALGVPLAIASASQFGFTTLILISVALYFGAGILTRYMRNV